MQKKIISGMQQIGVGVANVKEAWKWYKAHFGVDVRVFEEAAVAALMLPYTGGEPRKRHAAFALNIQGGGGFEIWQYTERIPQAPTFEVLPGDLGIFSAKIKCIDVNASFEHFSAAGISTIGPVGKDPAGNLHFFVKDPFGNIFNLVPGHDWFRKDNKHSGGVAGAIVGVTDMDRSIAFYRDRLEYNNVVYDATGVFDDFKGLPGGEQQFRRVLLRPGASRVGAFSRLFGTSEIELIQVLGREPKKIFQDRLWGDLGFIHLCFDVRNIDILRKECKEAGCPFTVDTGDTFGMGEASGIFAYIEDPDGALIEFVEAHKLLLIKKLGLSLNLKKRDPEKPLPNWLLGALRFSRATDIEV
jgi:catechol 2,3-dioxygenase-like lactoylglutathione lyase family enzyme